MEAISVNWQVQLSAPEKRPVAQAQRVLRSNLPQHYHRHHHHRHHPHPHCHNLDNESHPKCWMIVRPVERRQERPQVSQVCWWCWCLNSYDNSCVIIIRTKVIKTVRKKISLMKNNFAGGEEDICSSCRAGETQVNHHHHDHEDSLPLDHNGIEQNRAR